MHTTSRSSQNETLGAQKDTIELVQAGTIPMAVVAGPLLENFNPDFVVFNLPSVFASQEHQAKVVNDPAIVSGLYSLDRQQEHPRARCVLWRSPQRIQLQEAD